MSLRKLALAALFIVAMPLAAAQPAGAGPVVRFTPTAVIVDGITPGGDVAMLSVARVSNGFYARVVRKSEVISDDDRNGTITLEYREGVPAKAIWAFVDITSGDHAMVPTAGYEKAPLQFTEDRFKRASNGQMSKVEFPMGDVTAVLVRPGGAAWTATFARNSHADENRGTRAPARLDVSKLKPLRGNDAALDDFRKGDVLVAIDSRWMKYFSVVVSE